MLFSDIGCRRVMAHLWNCWPNRHGSSKYTRKVLSNPAVPLKDPIAAHMLTSRRLDSAPVVTSVAYRMTTSSGMCTLYARRTAGTEYVVELHAAIVG